MSAEKGVSLPRKFVDSNSVIFQTVESHGPFIMTLAAALPLQLMAGTLYCVMFGIQGLKEWEWRTKPIPMVILVLTFGMFISIYGRTMFHTTFLLGLLFSLAGDIVLMGESPDEFLLGLGLFLIAHVMYIITFSIPPKPGHPSVGWHMWRSLPFCFVSAFVPHFLASKLMDTPNPDWVLVVAVYIYSFVLAAMGWRACARIGYPMETRSSQIIAFVGALFFIASDFMLAVNKFHTPIPFVQVWVLSTYWIGQTALVLSLQREPWVQKPSSQETL